MKISDIKTILSDTSVDKEIVATLRKDDRLGVKKLLEAYEKKIEKKAKLKVEYKQKSIYEEKCYTLGLNKICGVDEVGRGPLAGPVVAAAVILKKNSYFEGLTDSKKLSEKKREELDEKIRKEALAYAIAAVDNTTIEQYNIYQASKIAMKKAVESLDIKPDYILVDAMPLDNVEIKSHSIIKGDEKSISIAAASVLAKVYRDKLMKQYAKQYPYYDFENNMGYGTKKHLEGLKQYGISPIHRRDFEPIKSMIKRGIDETQ